MLFIARRGRRTRRDRHRRRAHMEATTVSRTKHSGWTLWSPENASRDAAFDSNRWKKRELPISQVSSLTFNFSWTRDSFLRNWMHANILFLFFLFRKKRKHFCFRYWDRHYTELKRFLFFLFFFSKFHFHHFLLFKLLQANRIIIIFELKLFS